MNFGRIDFSASLNFQNDVAEGGWVTKIHIENPQHFRQDGKVAVRSLERRARVVLQPPSVA